MIPLETVMNDFITELSRAFPKGEFGICYLKSAPSESLLTKFNNYLKANIENITSNNNTLPKFTIVDALELDLAGILNHPTGKENKTTIWKYLIALSKDGPIPAAPIVETTAVEPTSEQEGVADDMIKHIFSSVAQKISSTPELQAGLSGETPPNFMNIIGSLFSGDFLPKLVSDIETKYKDANIREDQLINKISQVVTNPPIDLLKPPAL